MAPPPKIPHQPIHRQVVLALRTKGLVTPGEKVLVALSGGPDSVALLSILHDLAPAWNLSLAAVHCNFGLRGAESAADEAFVADFSQRLRVPCVIRDLSSLFPRDKPPRSVQATARAARYRVFQEVARELGANRVALGHQADDQAETVLLRMLRGAGLRGLSGMPHRRGLFIRPLLTVSRREILTYLQSREVPYRLDSSNRKSIYLRNRIRQEVLPVLTALSPAVVPLLARQADLVREDDRFLDALAAGRLKRLVHSRDRTTILVDRYGLTAQPTALQRRMLRQAVEALVSPPRVMRGEELLSILDTVASARSGKVWRVGAVTVRCEQRLIRLSVEPSPEISTSPPLSVTILRCLGGHCGPLPGSRCPSTCWRRKRRTASSTGNRPRSRCLMRTACRCL
ncbi:MAG: tRNA(Ile)-lysidine synthase [Nitrospira sp. OLB3]|nr:MAG: tRNA(Ile)-lysidine synthase [Nitrospira sp. OLB3]